VCWRRWTLWLSITTLIELTGDWQETFVLDLL
jgi:hypothetical protein